MSDQSRTERETLPSHSTLRTPSELSNDAPSPGYPGFPYSLNCTEEMYCPIGADPESEAATTDILPVREVAMMKIMDILTDRPGWEDKVFDDAIVKKWKGETLKSEVQELCNDAATLDKLFLEHEDETFPKAEPSRLVSENSFNYCIRELQEKAEYFKKTQMIPILDACSTVVKSDSLLPPELQQQLREALGSLRSMQETAFDWHPGSDEKVLDLVHPSMFPLVYGRSKAFKEKTVGVRNAISSWSGTGSTIPVLDEGDFPVSSGRHLWSPNYQWLPSNVMFHNDGKPAFSSYINNLHPRHDDVYRLIERLIDISIPTWDQVLLVNNAADIGDKAGVGRSRSRFDRPEQYIDDQCDVWDPRMPIEEIAQEQSDYEKQKPELKDKSHWPYGMYEWDTEAYKHWVKIRQPVLPEPEPCKPIDYTIQSSIRTSFAKRGLQVIVKIASIELTPDSPEFPAGGWHIEGQMNEHIAATALFYVDCENVTPSRLYFRQPTSMYESDNFQYEQGSYSYLECLYGTGLSMSGSECLQNLGSVETKEGRVLAFPNTLQHKVGSFRLQDPTKPGHRRFVALWLVDPYQRIVSTANVPPQQRSWWLDSIFSGKLEGQPELRVELLQVLSKRDPDGALKAIEDAMKASKLPEELAEMIAQHVAEDDWPMSLEEAKEHRLKLMEERTAFKDDVNNNAFVGTYSFCEH